MVAEGTLRDRRKIGRRDISGRRDVSSQRDVDISIAEGMLMAERRKRG